MSAKYKYENDECTSVSDTVNGIQCITKDSRYWSDVQEWVNAGNTIDPYITNA